MKVIAFDLGDTLLEYEGLPLSWEAHYDEALSHLATFLGLAPTRPQIERAGEILRRYNTRLQPRETEVTFAAILGELLQVFGGHSRVDELPCATAFFGVFRQKLRSFPETCATLSALRARGHKIGVFTDVPYGMPRELVLEDVARTSIAEHCDALLTSRDVGFRKPSPATLQRLAAELSCEIHDMAYVGNEKKDVEVARACGCSAILLNRTRRPCDWGQDRTIALLSEL